MRIEYNSTSNSKCNEILVSHEGIKQADFIILSQFTIVNFSKDLKNENANF